MREEYLDETGERFRDLFKNAEVRRDKRNHAIKSTLFWLGVLFCVGAVVLAKLHSMGAIAGVK